MTQSLVYFKPYSRETVTNLEWQKNTIFIILVTLKNDTPGATVADEVKDDNLHYTLISQSLSIVHFFVKILHH